MELGHQNKITVLVDELNLLREENLKLNFTLKRMISKYNELRKQYIRFLAQQRRGVDGSQVFNPDHSGKGINSIGAVNSHQSDHKRRGEKEEKSAKFMGDQQLHSKKRKIENEITLSMDATASPCCHEKSPKMQYQVPRGGSGEQTAAAPKRTVSVQTRSEASVINDGCHWRKYGQKRTRNNTRPRSYYKCAMVAGCPVKKQVQRCAQDPTIVITTYEGEHTHPLSPLAMSVMHSSSSNQLITEGLNTVNFVTDNQFLPIARISTSGLFPTITLDLTDNWPNPGIQLQPANLEAGSFQQTPLSTDLGHVLDDKNQLHNYSSIMQESVASIKADPNFTAALAVAIAGSLFNLRAPVQGMSEPPRRTQCTDGSAHEVFV